MSEKKLFHQNIVLNIAKNRCKSAQTITKMLVYKSEIWPKNHLPHTKSDCIGFKIASGIPVMYICVILGPGRRKYSLRWLYQEMLIYSQLR